MSDPKNLGDKRGEVDPKLVAPHRDSELLKTVHVPVEDIFVQRAKQPSSGAFAKENLTHYFLSCPPLPPIWLRPGVPVRFGRDRECEIILSGALVSRQHAVICVEGSRVILTDLGSTNGCYVNGERVETAILSPGDEIIIGTWGFIFRRQLGAPPDGNDELLMAGMGEFPTHQGSPLPKTAAVAIPDESATQESSRAPDDLDRPARSSAATMSDRNSYSTFSSQTY